MHIRKLAFCLAKGTDQEWTIESFDLETGMLIVGKNASGKSSTLNLIRRLAALIKGGALEPDRDGTWDVEFQNTDAASKYRDFKYQVHYARSQVLTEKLTVDTQVVLERSSDGTGSLLSTVSGQQQKFQVPEPLIAVAAKRDLLQHPYFESLHKWANSLRYYPFGTDMGKQVYGVKVPAGSPVDTSDWMNFIGVFSLGYREFNDRFKQLIISKMNKMGYDLEDIGFHPIKPQDSHPFMIQDPVFAIGVKERDLACWTMQQVMSQGMFRALALIIHLSYAELSGQPSCILLDDVGEGLDYDRSSNMIQLLLEVAAKDQVQILMATNDRFVMNAVPLEHWAIIDRKGSRCKLRTYKNSTQIFEDFKLTGLANFDLLRAGTFE